MRQGGNGESWRKAVFLSQLWSFSYLLILESVRSSMIYINAHTKLDINAEFARSWRQQLLIKTPLSFPSQIFKLSEKSMLRQNKSFSIFKYINIPRVSSATGQITRSITTKAFYFLFVRKHFTADLPKEQYSAGSKNIL